MENLNEGPHQLEELQYCMDLYPGLAELKSAEAISTKYHPGIQPTPNPTENSRQATEIASADFANLTAVKAGGLIFESRNATSNGCFVDQDQFLTSFHLLNLTAGS